jgi:hypothetical protein
MDPLWFGGAVAGCGVAAAMDVNKVKDAGFVTAGSCCQEGFDGY